MNNRAVNCCADILDCVDIIVDCYDLNVLKSLISNVSADIHA